jgi:putative pre-16S rRNA nuclease
MDRAGKTRRNASRMSVIELIDLPGSLSGGSRLLGLDLGEKTIGMAISDSSRRIAAPVDTLRRGKFTKDAKELLHLCADRGVGGLVIGLPLNMNGSEGPRCESVRQFAANLIEIAGYNGPIAFWDERLSTAAVERVLIGEADLSRKRRAKSVDRMAAAFILQGALDFLARDA